MVDAALASGSNDQEYQQIRFLTCKRDVALSSQHTSSALIMDQQNDLELAKQGNPQAISALMNYHLQPKGITVKTSLKNSCLMICLQSKQVPEQQRLVEFVRKGLTSLGVESIEKVKLYGYQTGADSVAWSHEFELAAEVHSTPTSSNKSYKKLQQATKTNNLNTNSSLSSNTQVNSFRSNGNKTNYSKPKTLAKKSSIYPYHLSIKPKFILVGTVSLLVIGLTAFTTQTLFGSSPSKTVDAFLSELSRGDEQAALQYWCFQHGSSLYAVRGWKKVRQEYKKFEVKPDNLTTLFPQIKEQIKAFSQQGYTELIFRVDSSNKGGMAITNDWKFAVWKTQDIPGFSVRANEIENILKQNTPSPDSANNLSQVIDISKLVMAQSDFFISTIDLMGDQDKLTHKKYCIAAIKEQ